jgi:hypothetical protein
MRIFTPESSFFYQNNLVLFSIALGLTIFILVYNRKRIDPESVRVKRTIIGFASILALGSYVALGIQLLRNDRVNVVFNKDEMTTPHGKIAYKNIKNSYLYFKEKKSPLIPNLVLDTTKMLIIEEEDGKKHVLLENDYPVDSIMLAIREQSIGKF